MELLFVAALHRGCSRSIIAASSPREVAAVGGESARRWTLEQTRSRIRV